MNRKHWVDIECEINGKRYPFTISPALSLMELLRDEGLTSVKQGCGVGEFISRRMGRWKMHPHRRRRGQKRPTLSGTAGLC